MSFSKFQELCDACYVTRTDLETEFDAHPRSPWVYRDEYADETLQADAESLMENIFRDETELDLRSLSERINAYHQDIVVRGGYGPVFATIGNIRASAARAASDAFRKYLDVLPDPPVFNPEDLRFNGKASPYGDMQFQTHIQNTVDGGWTVDTHHADYEAACMMYRGDFLALLIAREYDIEEKMP